MAGEKKRVIQKIVDRLRLVLDEGNLTAQMKEANGETDALTEREYTLYMEILGSWKIQLEELEE